MEDTKNINESIQEIASSFREKYEEYCAAARELRMMQDELENLQSDIADFRTNTLAGHSEDEDDYFVLEAMCDDVEDSFKAKAGLDLDDAIELCEDLNSED